MALECHWASLPLTWPLVASGSHYIYLPINAPPDLPSGRLSPSLPWSARLPGLRTARTRMMRFLMVNLLEVLEVLVVELEVRLRTPSGSA